MAEELAGAFSGGAQGFAAAGPVGGLIGAGIGLISGSSAKKKSKKAAKAQQLAIDEAAREAERANKLAAVAQIESGRDQAASLREYYDRSVTPFIPQQVAGNRAMSQLSSLYGLGSLPINAQWNTERGRLEAELAALDAEIGSYKKQYGAGGTSSRISAAERDAKNRQALEIQHVLRTMKPGTPLRLAAPHLFSGAPGEPTRTISPTIANDAAEVGLKTDDQKYQDLMRRRATLFAQMQNLPNEQQFQGTPEEARAKAVESFHTSPGYEFRLGEGNKAIERLASARGRLGAGSMHKDLMRFGQGLASDEYGNYVSQLQSMAGLATTASNSTGNAAMNMGGNMANTIAGVGDARSSAFQGMGHTRSDAALSRGGVNSQLQLAQNGINQNLMSTVTPYLKDIVSGWSRSKGAGGTLDNASNTSLSPWQAMA
jgi:hypothetical protein